MAISIDKVCVWNASIIRHQNPHKKKYDANKTDGLIFCFSWCTELPAEQMCLYHNIPALFT